MKNTLIRLFDLWMSKKHPNYYLIVSVTWILLVLIMIFAVISLWVFPSIWWKIIITDIALVILFKWVAQSYLNKYIDEFKLKDNDI